AQHVTAAVTHLVGTPKLILQSSDIDQLIVTNTVPHHLQQQKSKLVVLSIASAIAHVIQRNFYAN
ncbi:MAG: phosphoribosylpyrophosphate synthetase, partial [Zetaproteobacteria bacterium]|nr:phosphoribosylpyrophosphate synthetase [Zetaproteobacteria bacterium]